MSPAKSITDRTSSPFGLEQRRQRVVVGVAQVREVAAERAVGQRQQGDPGVPRVRDDHLDAVEVEPDVPA